MKLQLTLLALTVIVGGLANVYSVQTIVEMKKIVDGVEAQEQLKLPEINPIKTYVYNEQVPIAVVMEEVVESAERFRLNKKEMFDLAECESTFDNLAENPDPKSTACGVYAFVAQTWFETDSFKINRIACTDYKANIYEAHSRIAHGDRSPWRADPKVVSCMRKNGHKNW